MKTYTRFPILIAVAWIAVMPCISSAQVTDAQFKRLLSMLPGEWKGALGPSGIYHERWSLNADNSLSGSSGATQEDTKRWIESLEIRKMLGYWTYNASINGAAPVQFVLTTATADSWTFENKEHDYPQRIVYQTSSKDKITIRLDGTEHGEKRQESFRLTRVTGEQ